MPDLDGTVLIASDLDRTLIYSAAAMQLGEPVLDPVCVEVYDGNDISFMSPVAIENLVALAGQVPFVPCTTRTVEQYRRIRIPGLTPRHAITTNGANILVDGEPCADWSDIVDRAVDDCASYADARAVLGAVMAQPWVVKVRSAEDRFLYAVVEPGEVDKGWFCELEVAVAGLGWVLSLQGRKIYAIPSGLTKEAALAEIVSRVGATTIVAAGDSLLDRGLLEAADVAIRPAHGELEDQGWTIPGLIVTEQSGGRAGEEIVERFRVVEPA